MTAPTPEPTYYTAGRSRRAFLIGGGAAVVAAAGGFALWGSGVLAGADDAADQVSSGGAGPVDAGNDAGGDAGDQPDGANRDGGDDSSAGFASMAMVGDSITEASTPALQQVLGDRGYSSLDIQGKHSRRIEVGDGKGAPLSGIRTLFDMLSQGTSPDAWVIALGTNDVGQYSGEDDYVRLIDAMVGMLSSDIPLVWVDVYRPEFLDASQLFNQLLRERLDDRGNAVVADWYSRASDPDLGVLRSDHIHPNDRGTLVFADLVGDALSQLA